MPAYSIALGYHGCDSSVAKAIIEGEDMRPSAKPYDWLGHGLYFWEDSPLRAMAWAKKRCSQKGSKIKKPAVLGAVIDLGNCLNLIDAECLIEVQATFSALQSMEEFGLSLPENKGLQLEKRYRDCAVFEWLHQLREEKDLAPYSSVRGFFSEGEPLYPGAGLHKQDHIQICVRSAVSIIGFFRPRLKF
ncbi:hypothetical protein [Cerasicoccus arenae]|uniref:hypothetical protein n=1 Tax=Cerasicoccus arenae TaxID=424488 RepID=UPI001676D8F4|nr:hypothetical protein [Cerasicoccus arenae]MBK1858747.1 hypothetical protein [Cerasicoccus arenae]